MEQVVPVTWRGYSARSLQCIWWKDFLNVSDFSFPEVGLVTSWTVGQTERRSKVIIDTSPIQLGFSRSRISALTSSKSSSVAAVCWVIVPLGFLCLSCILLTWLRMCRSSSQADLKVPKRSKLVIRVFECFRGNGVKRLRLILSFAGFLEMCATFLHFTCSLLSLRLNQTSLPVMVSYWPPCHV